MKIRVEKNNSLGFNDIEPIGYSVLENGEKVLLVVPHIEEPEVVSWDQGSKRIVLTGQTTRAALEDLPTQVMHRLAMEPGNIFLMGVNALSRASYHVNFAALRAQ